MKRIAKKKTAPRLVNLNTATLDELIALPGIGKKLAKEIVAGRPYKTVRDLILLDGVSANLYAKLLPLLTASKPRKKKVIQQEDHSVAIEIPQSSSIEPPISLVEITPDVIVPVQVQPIESEIHSEMQFAPSILPTPVEPEIVAPLTESITSEPSDVTSHRIETIVSVESPKAEIQPEKIAASSFAEPAIQPVKLPEASIPRSVPNPTFKPKPAPPKTEKIRYVQTSQKRGVATVAYVLIAVIAVIFISAILIVTFSNSNGATVPPTFTPIPAGAIIVPSSTLPPVTVSEPTRIAATNVVLVSVASSTLTSTPTPEMKLTTPVTSTSALTVTRSITPTIGATPTNIPLAALPPFTTPDGVGAPIFLETFDPRKFYWGVANNSFSKSEVRDGQLVIRVNRNAVAYVFAGVLDTQDFYYQTTTRVGACAQTDQYGLQARASDDRNFYFFGVTCEGGALAYSVVGGSYNIIGSTPLKPFINKGEGAINVLALRAVGKDLQFFVNGELVYSISNTDHRRGKFGVFALAAWVPALTVVYDDVAAWKPTP